jgi:hypothetical protein
VPAVFQWPGKGRGDFGNPTHIVLRRSVDEGRTWSSRITLFDFSGKWTGGKCVYKCEEVAEG